MTSPEDISLRARFERFPATVKGAFVVRGEDSVPHQVRIEGARVVRVPGGTVRPVPITPVTLDVAPHKDVFVPFELAIAELEPAWYEFEVDADVDGSPRSVPGGRRFAIPWPRSAVRSGTLRADKPAALGGGVTARVERIQAGSDGLAVRYVVEPPRAVSVRLFADEDRLEVVEEEFDNDSGRGQVRAYPVLRSHHELRLKFKASAGKGREEPAEIRVSL
jgi:hypothetical protein